MANEAALAAWQARQQERKEQREKWALEAKEYEVNQALKTLAKHGLISEGENLTGLAKLRAEHEALKTAHQAAQDELAGARLAVAGDHQAAELARLQRGIRERDHFDAWKELATEAGMVPKAIRHAWQEAQANGFKAESDEVDRKALGSLMDRMRETHDYFWPSEPAPTPTDQPAARESKPATIVATNGVAHVFDRGAWRSGNGSAPP